MADELPTSDDTTRLGQPASQECDGTLLQTPAERQAAAEMPITPQPYDATLTQDAQTVRAATHWPSIPGYTVEGILGQGGMGIVYRARHQKLNRPAAIKMILGGSYASQGALDRFLNEVDTIARLQHAHIVQILDTGQHDGQPYYVMEYVDGPPLSALIEAGPVSAKNAALLCEKLALAVDYAHSKGVIHRDLKPSNILMLSDQVPKIMDFGIAKRQDTGHDLTATGAVLGTPGYLSPEQAQGRTDQIGPATDLFSLGVILYELLTARRPFDGGSQMDVLTKIMEVDPVSPAAIQPGVPKDLETICLQCLQKNPARRYASAAELADDLRRYLTGNVIRARQNSKWEQAWKWTIRNPGKAALIGSAAVLLAATLIGLSWHNRQLKHSLDRSERLVGYGSDFSLWVIKKHLFELRTLNGSTPAQLELVTQLQEFLDKTGNEATQDVEFLQRLALAHEQVADVLGNPGIQNLGRSPESYENYQKAIRLYERARELDPAKAASDPRYVNCMIKMSGLVLQEQGRTAMSSWLAKAEKELAKLPENSSAKRALSLELRKCKYWEAHSANRLQDTLSILDQYERQLQQLEPQDLTDSDRRLDLCWLWENRGRTYLDLAEADQAKAAYAKLLALSREDLATNPRSWLLQDRLCSALVGHADVDLKFGDPSLAIPYLEEALQIRRALLADDPHGARGKSQLTVVLERQANGLQLQQKYAESVPIAEECVQLRRELVAIEPQNAEFQRNLWIALQYLGDGFYQSQQLPQGAKAYQEQLAIVKSLIAGNDTPEIPELEGYGQACFNLGTLEFVTWTSGLESLPTGDPADSEHYRQAVDYFKQAEDAYAKIKQQTGNLTPTQTNFQNAIAKMYQLLEESAERVRQAGTAPQE